MAWIVEGALGQVFTCGPNEMFDTSSSTGYAVIR